MWRILRAICCVLAVWLPASPVVAADRDADHEALRAILRVGAEALNTGEFDEGVKGCFLPVMVPTLSG